MRIGNLKTIVASLLLAAFLSISSGQGQRRLVSVERRFPSNFCPIVAEGTGDFSGSFAVRFIADARRVELIFEITNNTQFDDLSAGIDNIVVVRAGDIANLRDYAVRASQLDIECVPNGYSLDLVRLKRDLPESIVFEDLFADATCSVSNARRCWDLNAGAQFDPNDGAPDNPGGDPLRFDTGFLAVDVPQGAAPTSTDVTLDNLEVGEEYIVTGWWSSSHEHPDVEFELFYNSMPENDLCANALSVATASFNGVVNTENLTASGEPAPSCANIGRTAWYRYQPETDGILTVDTAGSDFNTLLAVYRGSCFNPIEVACNNDLPDATRQARVRTFATAGQTYLIQMGGFLNSSGNLRFSLQFEPTQKLYFPQIAHGGPITTAFSFVSTATTAEAMGRLMLFGPEGQPQPATIGGSTDSVFELDLPPRGSAFPRIIPSAVPVEGWGYFESDRRVAGVATFELRNPDGSLATLAGVLGTAPLRRATLPVESAAGTGVAAANPGTSAVTVRLRLLNVNGSESGQAPPLEMILESGRHFAGFVPTLFGLPLTGFSGSLLIEVVGPGQIIVTGLVLREGVLSAIPVERL